MGRNQQKADKTAEQLIIGISEALNGESQEFDLTDALKDGDVTAFFEGMLVASSYFYVKLVDADADLVDMIHIFNRLAVARVAETERNRGANKSE